jgi:hypothetical protein
VGRRELARSIFGALLSMGLLWAATGAAAGIRPSAMGSGRAIRLVGKETPVRTDLVRFTNGDMLSGKVQEIVEGSVTIKPEVADATLTIPAEALKEVVFGDGAENRPVAGDRVVLVNGEGVSGKIERMAEGKVLLTMPSLQEVEIKGEDVAAISFHRDAEVLAQESFDSGLPGEIGFEGGEWRTQGGWLLQRDSRAVECFASLPVTQTGEIVYEWTVNTTIGRSTGMYFMASDADLWQERAYFVRVLRRYVYIYLCRNGEEVYCGTYQIALHKNQNTVRLKCDADRGRFAIWIDGTEVGRWQSSVPIRMGKYVILRADGRAAFDDLIVMRKAGAVRVDPSLPHGDGDVLKLVNGDEILGTVRGVSEGKVLLEGYGDEVPGIEKGKLLYVRFGRNVGKLPRAMGGTVAVVMRDGDRISGELVSLKDGVVRMRSELAGVVELRAEDVKKVIFKEFP